MISVTGKNDGICLAADWHLSQIFGILSLERRRTTCVKNSLQMN